MKLKDLADAGSARIIRGSGNTQIKDLVYHSSEVSPGSLFFAIQGQTDDGKKYVKEAVRKGAAAVVISDNDINKISWDIPTLAAADVRKTMAQMSADFYARPSKDMLIIGVTGTKGKTGTTFMIRQMLEKAGIKTGIIGTIYNGYKDHISDAVSTTPQSVDIQRYLYTMKKAGCRAVVIEVSSQGLMQSRTDEIDFDIGIFTNLSPDHIGKGEHADFNEYVRCKSMLFKKCKRAIINIDDPHYNEMIEGASLEKTVYFGKCANADFIIENHSIWIKDGRPGVKYTVRSKKPCGDDTIRELKVDLPGIFNVYNSLAAAAVAKSLGVPWSVIEEVLENIKIPGRTEIIETEYPYTVILDYAHNGVSLRNLLKSLREYNPERIILVFGCGGNRDRNRRYEMAAAASENADLIIVTSDNPRREDPDMIISDITGAIDTQKKPVIVVPDRRMAIWKAMEEGKEGDMIVIAGKGHEKYQIIGEEKKFFDDREEVLSYRREEQ